jgi:hypothetical protein
LSNFQALVSQRELWHLSSAGAPIIPCFYRRVRLVSG